MPRQLIFKIKRKEYTVIPEKIDRKKLYGWTEIQALDEKGRECRLLTTDQTGTLIIPKGGSALGILSPEKNWVDRSGLKTVRLDGSPAALIHSSYSQVTSLKQKVKEEEFLDHSITDFYQLKGDIKEFVKVIGNDIYNFDYTYLDSYETVPAFILISEQVPFMLTGYRNKFEMLCLGDCENVTEDDDYIEINDDDIDFSMF